MVGPILLAAPDKFRGSLNAVEAADAIAAGAERAGWSARPLPLADGGEGMLQILGGPNRRLEVTGPLGASVQAGWRLAGGLAVVEAAQASGLALLGGAAANDPIRASTRGTGQLIAAALEAGARRIIVGVGGSATTDGGRGAIEVLRPYAPFRVPVEVACDVQTSFLDAAGLFAPQKGATPEHVEVLAARLHALADRYRREFGVDVARLVGAGAAGGLAGGLAALGATLTPGFDLVADAVGLDEALAGAEFVVTGEGRLDATSFAGKVVGGVQARAALRNIPVLVIAGEINTDTHGRAVSLVERFGAARSWASTKACIAEVVAEALALRRL
jgi:glycerate 2-kinase